MKYPCGCSFIALELDLLHVGCLKIRCVIAGRTTCAAFSSRAWIASASFGDTSNFRRSFSSSSSSRAVGHRILGITVPPMPKDRLRVDLLLEEKAGSLTLEGSGKPAPSDRTAIRPL
jgi:hypothetical protein